MSRRIDNVFTVAPEWAAKIFAGVKQIEVRSRRPPGYTSGLYGIAVTGVPDLVVGRVRVTQVEELSAAELAERVLSTRIPAERLQAYLRGRKCCFAWHLSDACVFRDPIPFYSDGQTIKGAPRTKQQPHVEAQMLAAAHCPRLSEDELKEHFECWRVVQCANRNERKEHKRKLFERSRAVAAPRKNKRRSP